MEPLLVCDLTNHDRGIPLFWISLTRSRSARTWDALTSMATSILFTNNNNNDKGNGNNAHPQGFVEAVGAKSISIMKTINEYPDEGAHCWLARALCRLQQENMVVEETTTSGGDSESTPQPQSAIFGTLWNPYIGALKHK